MSCTFYHPPQDFDDLRAEMDRKRGRRSRSHSAESNRGRHVRDRRRVLSRSRSRSRGFSQSPGRCRNGSRIPPHTPWSRREEDELVRYCAKNRIEGDWIPEENFHEIRDRFNREIRDIRAALLRLRCKGVMRGAKRDPRPWSRREEEELIRYADYHKIGDWLSPDRTRKISKSFDRELKDIKSCLLKLRAEGRLPSTRRDQLVEDENPWREWEDRWLIEFVQKWRIDQMFTPDQVKDAKNTVNRTLNDIKTRLFKLRHDGRIPHFGTDSERPRDRHDRHRMTPPFEPRGGGGGGGGQSGPPPPQSMAAPIDPPYGSGYVDEQATHSQHTPYSHVPVRGQEHGQQHQPPPHPSYGQQPAVHPPPPPQHQREAQKPPYPLHTVPPPPPPRPRKVVDPRDPRKRAKVERIQKTENGNGHQSRSGAVYGFGDGQQPVPGQMHSVSTVSGMGHFNEHSQRVSVVPSEQVGPPPPPPPVVHAERRENVENPPVHEEHHAALMHGSDYSVCDDAKTQSMEAKDEPAIKHGTEGGVNGQRVPVRTEEEERALRRAMDITSLSTSLEKELERGRQMLTNMKQPNDKNGQKGYIQLLRRQIECLKKSNLEMWKYQNQRNKMQIAAAGNSRSRVNGEK